MYWIAASRSSIGRPCHGGIAVPRMRRVTSASGRRRSAGALDEAELEHGQLVARAELVHERRRRTVAVALDAVAAHAAPLVHLLAVGDPLLGARDPELGRLQLLRLEQVAPRPRFIPSFCR